MITLKTLIVNAPAPLREQLDHLSRRMALIHPLAVLRPGALTSTTASTKVALRALARRWLALDAEIKEHDLALDALTDACAPGLKRAHGIATGTAAEMLMPGDEKAEPRPGAVMEMVPVPLTLMGAAMETRSMAFDERPPGRE